MALANLQSEERIGLVAAVAIHAGLLALLVLHPGSRRAPPPPERMSVTLSDEVGLTSTSPEPQAAPAPEAAPVIGEMPEPPPQPEALPEPIPVPQPRVVPQPRPVAAPAPRPAPRAAPPKPQSAAKPRATTPPTTRPAGANRIGSDFLKGIPNAPASGAARNPPAAAIGPAVQASLSSAISRQLKPHWQVPQGQDAELLVTRVRFRLARDGSLVGDPEALDTTGVSDANRAQVQRHREQAIRAVRLAAPFDLPEEFYSAWQSVTSRFDRRLSQ